MGASARSAVETKKRANTIRRWTIETIHRCGGGHFGGSLSAIDILAVLQERIVRRRDEGFARDRFILSKGHAAPAYYATLASFGAVSRAKLDSFARFGSALQGHPDRIAEPLMDFSTGSLGQGLSVGLGMALASGPAAEVWVLLGDGECQEGQVWEAAMLADRLRTDNICAIVDANGYQEWGFRRDGQAPLPPVTELAAKWLAFGWRVVECDGHDHGALEDALRSASRRGAGPGVIIARTVKGYGAPLIEAEPDRFHCGMLSDTEYRAVLDGLMA